MSNAVYQFNYPAACAGLSAVVLAPNGQPVQGSPITIGSGGETDVTLPALVSPNDRYVARLTVTEGNAAQVGALGKVGDVLVTHGAVDLFASIASIAASEVGSPVGATETAYFIATGPTYATDGGGSAGTLVLEADPEHDELPGWASIVDGDIALTDASGTCSLSFAGVFDFDFSATTPQTSEGTISSGLLLKLDGQDLGSNMSGSADGDGLDAQTTPVVRAGHVFSGALIACEAYPGADDVTDGTATPRVALTLTRIAQAAVVPEA